MSCIHRLGILAIVLLHLQPLFAADPPVASAIEAGAMASESLGREEFFEIYLPPGYKNSKETYPVLYFLHGMFDHQGTWQERGIGAQVDKLIAEGAVKPMVIAIPNGGRFSFWCNSLDGTEPVEDFVLKDFIPYIEKQYRVEKTRSQKQGTDRHCRITDCPVPGMREGTH